jgi:hypothetical protein
MFINQLFARLFIKGSDTFQPFIRPSSGMWKQENTMGNSDMLEKFYPF